MKRLTNWESSAISTRIRNYWGRRGNESEDDMRGFAEGVFIVTCWIVIITLISIASDLADIAEALQ